MGTQMRRRRLRIAPYGRCKPFKNRVNKANRVIVIVLLQRPAPSEVLVVAGREKHRRVHAAFEGRGTLTCDTRVRNAFQKVVTGPQSTWPRYVLSNRRWATWNPNPRGLAYVLPPASPPLGPSVAHILLVRASELSSRSHPSPCYARAK